MPEFPVAEQGSSEARPVYVGRPVDSGPRAPHTCPWLASLGEPAVQRKGRCTAMRNLARSIVLVLPLRLAGVR